MKDKESQTWTMENEGPLEKQWRDYQSTGITAQKGTDALALRLSFDSKKYAVIKLYGGCWKDSPIQVIEEIHVQNLDEAKARFRQVASDFGFQEVPIRRVTAETISWHLVSG